MDSEDLSMREEGGEDEAHPKKLHWKNMQSITEVLQDPGGGSYYAPSLSAAGGAKTKQFGPVITEKTFESYLMLLTSRYEEYRSLEAFATEKNGGRTRSGAVRQEEDLASIPRSYFDPNFRLSMSEELNELNELDSFSNLDASREVIQATQNTISRYVTLVENELYARVKRQRQALAVALEQVDKLRSLIEESCSTTAELRKRTQAFTTSAEKGPLQVSALNARRVNMQMIMETLSLGSDVRMAPQLVELLLRASDYDSAMEAVNAARLKLSTPPLNRVRAFEASKQRLEESARSIDDALLSDFENLFNELEESDAWNEMQEALTAIVASVVKLDRLPSLLSWLKNNRSCKLKDLIDSEGKDMVETFGAMKAQIRVAAKVLNLLPDEEQVRSAKEAICGNSQARAAELVRNELYAVQRLIDDEARGMRKAASILSAAISFNDESEQLLNVRRGRFSYLRAATSERAAAYTSTLHRVHVDRLSAALKAERWLEVNVPRDVQMLVVELRETSIASAAPAAPERIAARKKKKEYEFVSLDDDDDDDDEGVDLGDTASGQLLTSRGSFSDVERLKLLFSSSLDEDNTSEHLYIGSQKLKVVDACLLLIRSTVLYAMVCRALPFGEELGRRVLELIRTYNDLVSQQVLGANAIKTVGLRGISARHLALSSQAVALALALLPMIVDAVKDRLQPTYRSIFEQSVTKLHADLTTHHQRVLDKIVIVMMDRFEVHKSALLALPWASENSLRSEPLPSGYMVSLVKETNVLHRILLNILARKQLFDVYTRLGGAYGSGLKDAYATLDTSKEWIKRRIASDVSYLRLKLRAMEAVISTSDAGTMQPVEELWQTYVSDSSGTDGDSSSSAKTKEKTSSSHANTNEDEPSEGATKPAQTNTGEKSRAVDRTSGAQRTAADDEEKVTPNAAHTISKQFSEQGDETGGAKSGTNDPVLGEDASSGAQESREEEAQDKPAACAADPTAEETSKDRNVPGNAQGHPEGDCTNERPTASVHKGAADGGGDKGGSEQEFESAQVSWEELEADGVDRPSENTSLGPTSDHAKKGNMSEENSHGSRK